MMGVVGLNAKASGPLPGLKVPHKHIGQRDGLPTARINRLIQDSKGFIWIATDLGVCRYDGIEMEYFTRNDGLASNQVFQIFEDGVGRIWFLAFKASPCYYWQGEITVFEDWERSIDEYAVRIFHAADGGIWLSSTQHYLKIAPDLQLVWQSGEDDPVAHGIVDLSKDRQVFLFQNKVELRDQGQKTDLLLSHQGKFFGSHLHQHSENEFWAFHVGDPSYQITFSPPSIQVHPPLAEMIRAEGKGWAIGNEAGMPVVLQGGLRRVVPSWFQLPEQAREYLLHQGIGNMIEDRNGDLWVSTRSKGIFLFSKQALRAVDVPNPDLLPGKKVEALEVDDAGRVWLGTANGQLGVWEKGSLRSIPVVNRDGFVNPCYDILMLSDGRVACGFNRGILLIDEQGNYHNFRIDNNKTLLELPGGALVKSGGLRLFEFGLEGLSYRSPGPNGAVVLDAPDPPIFEGDLVDSLEIGPTCMANEAGGGIWLGTPRGLYLREGNSRRYFGDEFPELGAEIRALAVDEEGRLWIATFGEGLVCLDGEKVRKWGKKDGLISEFCYAVMIEGTQLWLGTNRGLQQLSLEGGGITFARTLTMRDGLPSNEVNCIVGMDSILFLGGPEGLTLVYPAALTSERPEVPVYISSLTVEGNPLPLSDTVALDHRPDDLKISFLGLDYFSGGELFYGYRLLPHEENWNTGRQRTVSYAGLGPGTYTFEVETLDNSSPQKDAPTRLWIHIPPAWHQLLWVRILLGVLGAILLLGGMLFLSKAVSRRANLKRQLIEVEQKALRTQMNPHFIFNSMNVIQGFIAQKDLLKANQYLSIFGQLIRMTLKQSEKGWIKLEEETAFLKLYLKFEMARFPDEFDYELEIEGDLRNLDPYIPSMLLQPLIENSIRHGFQGMDRRGRIEISLCLEEGRIAARVEDNGIGRAAALRLKEDLDRSRKGMGISNTRERLALLARDLKEPTVFEVIDIPDKQGGGTRIELKFSYRQQL